MPIRDVIQNYVTPHREERDFLFKRLYPHVKNPNEFILIDHIADILCRYSTRGQDVIYYVEFYHNDDCVTYTDEQSFRCIQDDIFFTLKKYGADITRIEIYGEGNCDDYETTSSEKVFGCEMDYNYEMPEYVRVYNIRTT